MTRPLLSSFAHARVAFLVLLTIAAAAAAEAGLDPFGTAAPPSVIARDTATGQVTVRALRLTVPFRVDGRLDDAIYDSAPYVSDFIQAEPAEGMPASERTDVWIFFDDENLYVAARCWESHPERMVVNEMRRDNGAIAQNENFAFALDTFRDRRSAVILEVNAAGGRMDSQVSGEQVNIDWNTIWDVAVQPFDGGWAVEVAVPFKSLRYRPGESQVWGFNARRRVRYKNENSYLTAIPAPYATRGLSRLTLNATLVGVEVPPGVRNLDIKPYGNIDLTTDNLANPPIQSDPNAAFGVDAKYGIMQNLTADLTYNTDFAQVEADEQQVNLTRFSLLFPEKRDFFLENRGVFTFGGAAFTASDAPQLFYSRRIGLQGNREVPIVAGGRVSGRVGRFNLGMLNIQTDDEPVSGAPSTNFSVLRVNRDLLRNSSVGMMVTRRSVDVNGGPPSLGYGVDATLAFSYNVTIHSYWAQTSTEGRDRDDTSYRSFFDYNGDLFGIQAEHLLVGDNFNPEVGYVQRHDMRKTFGLLRYSPRPRSFESIRKLSWTGSMAYIENLAGQLETRDWTGQFAIEFQNSDQLRVEYNGLYERLPRPFTIAPGVTLPAAGYDFGSVIVGFAVGQQRRASAEVAVEYGTFYSGHKTALSASRGRIRLTRQFSMEPNVSVNRIDLPEGAFTTTLVGSRVTYTMTPMMFVSALLQYNSSNHVVSGNVRLRWEYRPGSELFVVYNEQRDTGRAAFAPLANRAVILKINRLLRF